MPSMPRSDWGQGVVNDIGDMVLGTDGSYMIRPPERCANGHQLAGHCIVASTLCSCQDRHLSWSCDRCGHITYGPPLEKDCSHLHGPARVR